MAEDEGGGAAEEASGGGGGIGAGEVMRIAALMKIDIGEAGGAEEREHVERVRKMVAYFDMLDRAGGAGDAGGGAGDAGGGAGDAGGGAGDAGGGAGDAVITIGELRADEPDEGGGAAAEAASYARVQEEGGAYVRAPQV